MPNRMICTMFRINIEELQGLVMSHGTNSGTQEPWQVGDLPAAGEEGSPSAG